MKNKERCVCIVMMFCLSSVFAQNWPGIRDSIYSDALKETRKLQIILPKEYQSDPNEKFEVLYVLDGEWYMEQIPFIYNFAASSGYAPPSIFVLIPNTYVNKVNLRDRDFSPTQIDNVPHLGGADNFHAFIKNELIPYVEKKYRTNGQRSLVGSSFSGLFSVYAFVKEPELFQSFVASDPNLNWDNGYVSKLAAKKLPDFSHVTSTLFIAGLEHTYRDMGSQAFDSVLKAQAPKSLHWKCIPYSNETHYSVQHKAFYDGFRFSHFGYSTRPPEFHPMNGIMEKDKPLKLFILNDNPAARYTTDGSDPIITSAIMKRGDIVTLSGPAEVKVKSFSNRAKYDQSGHGSFHLGEILPLNVKSKKDKTGGLRYSYFEGDWSKLPDFKNLKPLQSGAIDKDFKIDKLPHEGAAFLIEGSFEITEDGYYVFVLESDNEAKLVVGDKMIIERSSASSKGMQSFVLPLKKGMYPVRVELLRKKGASDPHFFVNRTKTGNDQWWQTEFFRI